MQFLMLGLIVVGTSYLAITLAVADAAAALSEAPFFGNLFAKLAHSLPGADYWPAMFDLQGHLGPVPYVVIALAVLAVPFALAGLQIKRLIALKRERDEQRLEDKKTARDEQVRMRERTKEHQPKRLRRAG